MPLLPRQKDMFVALERSFRYRLRLILIGREILSFAGSTFSG